MPLTYGWLPLLVQNSIPSLKMTDLPMCIKWNWSRHGRFVKNYIAERMVDTLERTSDYEFNIPDHIWTTTLHVISTSPVYQPTAKAKPSLRKIDEKENIFLMFVYKSVNKDQGVHVDLLLKVAFLACRFICCNKIRRVVPHSAVETNTDE